MAIVNMGGDSAINVFEVACGFPSSGDRGQMGGPRGPIDHYAFCRGVRRKRWMDVSRSPRRERSGPSHGRRVTHFGSALLFGVSSGIQMAPSIEVAYRNGAAGELIEW